MVLMCMVAAALGAQIAGAGVEPTPLQKLGFLFGDWVAKGGTELGNAEGVSSFAPEVGNRIVVRRSWVAYSSAKEAGTKHEDLLIIYAEDPGPRLRAIYFDGEGHVIHYHVTIPSPDTAVFESDPSQPGPRYRLTHAVKGRTMETQFEIAPPGQPQYRTYVSGTATRK